jgi:hypothetical protein
MIEHDAKTYKLVELVGTSPVPAVDELSAVVVRSCVA